MNAEFIELAAKYVNPVKAYTVVEKHARLCIFNTFDEKRMAEKRFIRSSKNPAIPITVLFSKEKDILAYNEIC